MSSPGLIFMKMVSKVLAPFLFAVGLVPWMVSPAQAAEDITFIVGPINRSITLTQLQRLADTGEAKGDLKTILKIAGQSPEDAGAFLNQTIPFDLVTAYRLLTSAPGEALLGKLETILAPRRSNQAGAEALRAAILLSLSGDNEFTILELLEKYPTDVRVNVNELQNVAGEFGDITELIGSFTGN